MSDHALTQTPIWLYGTEGTIYVDQRQNIFAGRRGDTQLSEVPNPPEAQAYYRVEEEFTNAIRGTEQVTMAPSKRACITWSRPKR